VGTGWGKRGETLAKIAKIAKAGPESVVGSFSFFLGDLGDLGVLGERHSFKPLKSQPRPLLVSQYS
jgi:hypothetical protein